MSDVALVLVSWTVGGLLLWVVMQRWLNDDDDQGGFV